MSDAPEGLELDARAALIKVQNQDYDKLLADLARYREAVGVAVAALESVLADGQENYVGSGLYDARNALAVLKRLG